MKIQRKNILASLRRLKFTRPPKAASVFFDRNGYKIFASSLKTISHVIVPCRSEEYWIHPIILIGALKWLSLTLLRRKKLGATLRESITIAYFAAILSSIKCKVAVTFTDNSSLFQFLTALCDKIFFIAVQNGTRLYGGYWDPGQPCHFDLLLSFGKYEPEHLKSIGQKYNTCLPVGSARLGELDVPALKCAETRYDICIVSQFREGMIGGDDMQLKSIGKALSFICESVAKLAINHNWRIAVAMAGEESSEADYFRHYFGSIPTVSLISNVIEIHSSYYTAASAKIVIGLNSTLLLEMLAIGKKVLFCNAGEQKNEDFPIDYEFALRRPSVKLFTAKILKLISYDNDIYSHRFGSFQSYVINQNDLRPPTMVLRELIEDVLREPSNVPSQAITKKLGIQRFHHV